VLAAGQGRGYFLSRPPRELTVGEVVRFIEGPLGPVRCVVRPKKTDCPLYGDCVFLPMWEEVGRAVANV